MLRLRCQNLLLCIGCGVLSLSAAQIVSGTIAGSVKDSSGAAIPGAKVGLVNTETNLSRESASNESGDFIFSTLPPGKYQITASHAGFKEFFNILNNIKKPAKLLDLNPQRKRYRIKQFGRFFRVYSVQSVHAPHSRPVNAARAS